MAERSPEIEQRIIDGLSKGTPLAVLCREEGMVSDRAVRYWMEEDADFASAIARARELGFDAIAAECMEIADDLEDDPASRRVRTDVRLKLLAKWDPKRYGELVKHSGPDGEGPIQAAVSVTFRKTDDSDERRAS